MHSLTAVCLALSFAPANSKPTPPPGLVTIEGGATHIGTPAEQVCAMSLKNDALFNSLAAETPAHDRRIESFDLMVTEVTNEQYLVFVQATGALPPQSWGRAAIEEAARRFPGEEDARQKEAKTQGKDPGPARRFDGAEWWKAHASEGGWSIPEGEAGAPVVYVDHHAARAYARWAGLRLMTEFEFQRAGRGTTANVYPWGADWDDAKYCSTKLLHEGRPRVVASFPLGATRAGVFDLAGNVWEWTASPFIAYPNYKELQIRVQKNGETEIKDTIAHWKPDQFVVVGGSFQNSQIEARLATRRPAEPDQSTDAIGFRCAASLTPWIDLAHAVVELDLAGSPLLKGVALDLEHPICADRWTAEPGTVTHTVREEGDKTKTEPLPNYAVIRAYDEILYVPSTGTHVSSVAEVKAESAKSGAVRLGVFSTSKRVTKPALIAGSYVLGYRAARAEVPTDQFVFFDAKGEIAATLEGAVIEFGRPPNGKVAMPDASAAGATEHVSIKGYAMSDVKGRGTFFDLPLEFDAGTLGTGWRD